MPNLRYFKIQSFNPKEVISSKHIFSEAFLMPFTPIILWENFQAYSKD